MCPMGRVRTTETGHKSMSNKYVDALSVIEASGRLGLSKDAVKRRIGTELRGYRHPQTGWWMITLDSVERWETEHAAEIEARDASL